MSIQSTIFKRFGVTISKEDSKLFETSYGKELMNNKNIEFIFKILIKYLAVKKFSAKYFYISKNNFYDSDSVDILNYSELISKLFNLNIKDKYYLRNIRQEIDKQFPQLTISHLWNLPYIFTHNKSDIIYRKFRDKGIIPKKIKEYIKLQQCVLPDEDEIDSINCFIKFCEKLFTKFKNLSRKSFIKFTSDIARDLFIFDFGFATYYDSKIPFSPDFINKIFSEKHYHHFTDIQSLNSIVTTNKLPAINIKMHSWSRLNTFTGIRSDKWIEFVGPSITNVQKYGHSFVKYGTILHKDIKEYHSPQNYTTEVGIDHYMLGAYIYEYLKQADNVPNWFFKFVRMDQYGNKFIQQQYANAGIPVIKTAINIAFIASTIYDFNEYFNYLEIVAKNTTKPKEYIEKIKEKFC